MTYEAFLERVISDGIRAAEVSYADDPLKRAGAVAGFEACRGKTPDKLDDLLRSASEAVSVAFREQAKDYWRTAAYRSEVDYVCNVVSALLVSQGRIPVFYGPPTCRGWLRMSEILNG